MDFLLTIDIVELMSFFALLYFGLGAVIAAGMMMIPSVRSTFTTVAHRLDMPIGYARAIWIIGTTIAWPIGLYVASTGRLVSAAADDAVTASALPEILARSERRADATAGETDLVPQTLDQHA